MKIQLKKLEEQVMVITGASSGIGLATARMAAGRGARVVLNSRDETDLADAARSIQEAGGAATVVVGDVADRGTMDRIGEAALRQYARIDTWVNNAGVSIYGRLEDVSLEDARRLFETNYWGVVNGSLAALPHLKEQGGALINVGSILSETGYALQGHYTASKHAVKGFTDSLRIELEHDKAPVSVTLIEPAAIDTPYPEHAENYLGVKMQQVPPVYAPEVVAKAILTCAEAPHRNVIVGGGGRMFQAMENTMPGIADRFKASAGWSGQFTDELAYPTGTLHRPRPNDARVRGDYEGRVMRSSAYTRAVLHPAQAVAAAAVIGAAAYFVTKSGIFGNGHN